MSGKNDLSQLTAEHRTALPSEAERAVSRDNVPVHRRQFVIGPRPVEAMPGWVSIQLQGTGYLSHCPELQVSHVIDAAGNQWSLLGLAVQTIVDRPDPVQELKTTTFENIEDLYHTWSGRWLLVGNSKLHMDCCGLLGCFYGIREFAGTGSEFWVSSSPAILAELFGLDPQPGYKIEHGYGFDWYIPPGSGLYSVNRLLPSQVLDLSKGLVSARQLIAPLPQKLHYEEIMDELQTYLITTLKNVSDISNRLWLALTGGLDSRTLLSTLKYAGIPVRAYTHSHGQLSHADMTLPPRLAGIVDIDYTQIRGGEYSAELEEMYDRHTAGHCVDRDRFYYSYDYFKWCRKGDIILRGHCFAIGRDNRGTFPVEQYGQDLPEADEIIEKYMQRGFKYTGRDPVGFFPSQLYQALSKWVAWSKSWPEKGINWRDRLTMEQRHAGWLSSIEQSLDLIDADRFHPGNSHYFYALVMQIPEKIRMSKQSSQQHELIRRMAPELLEFPFNPPDPIPLYERILDRFKTLAKIAVGKRT